MSESLFQPKPFGEPLRETPQSPQTLIPDLPTSPTPPDEARELSTGDRVAGVLIVGGSAAMMAFAPENWPAVLLLNTVLGIAVVKKLG
jgi:hypothetical protein